MDSKAKRTVDVVIKEYLKYIARPDQMQNVTQQRAGLAALGSQ